MRVRFYYTPFRPLKSMQSAQRDMERIFQQWWECHSGLPRAHGRIWVPPTDVCETPTQLIIKMEMAGMTEDQIQIVLYNDYVVVSGRREDERITPRSIVHQMDIWYGDFRAEIPIPARVDYDRVEADYRNGMIYITMPKASEVAAEPTRVHIASTNATTENGSQT